MELAYLSCSEQLLIWWCATTDEIQLDARGCKGEGQYALRGLNVADYSLLRVLNARPPWSPAENH